MLGAQRVASPVKVTWPRRNVQLRRARELRAANNYADTLHALRRFEEAKALLRKTIPVARRVLGKNHRLTLKMRYSHAEMLYQDPGATLDNLREAVRTLEEIEPATRRVLGGTHPIVMSLEVSMWRSRAALAARDNA